MRPELRQPCGLPLFNDNSDVTIPYLTALPLSPPLVVAASAMKVVNTSDKVIKITNGLDGTVNITFSPKPTGGSWGLSFLGIGSTPAITDLSDGTILNTLQDLLNNLLGSENVVVQGNYTDGIQLIFPQTANNQNIPLPTLSVDLLTPAVVIEISQGNTQKEPTMIYLSTPNETSPTLPVVLAKGQTLSAQAMDDSAGATTGFLTINFFQ